MIKQYIYIYVYEYKRVHFEDRKLPIFEFIPNLLLFYKILKNIKSLENIIKFYFVILMLKSVNNVSYENAWALR